MCETEPDEERREKGTRRHGLSHHMMHDPGASKCAVLCRASLRTSLVHILSPHAPCRALCRGGGRGGCQRLT